MTHTRRKRNTYDARVLHVLMDGQKHTQVEIAFMFDVTPKTIFRAVQNLKEDFEIHTFRGGKLGGGMRLDDKHLYFGLVQIVD